jgi:hypothetical protein
MKRTVRQVGYLQRLYQDVRSTERNNREQHICTNSVPLIHLLKGQKQQFQVNDSNGS